MHIALNQTSQVSRLGRESHVSKLNVTISRPAVQKLTPRLAQLLKCSVLRHSLNLGGGAGLELRTRAACALYRVILCYLYVAIMAERNESSCDAGVDRFYLSDEFEEEEDETRPDPSKRAKTGAKPNSRLNGRSLGRLFRR